MKCSWRGGHAWLKTIERARIFGWTLAEGFRADCFMFRESWNFQTFWMVYFWESHIQTHQAKPEVISISCFSENQFVIVWKYYPQAILNLLCFKINLPHSLSRGEIFLQWRNKIANSKCEKFAQIKISSPEEVRKRDEKEKHRAKKYLWKINKQIIISRKLRDLNLRPFWTM